MSKASFTVQFQKLDFIIELEKDQVFIPSSKVFEVSAEDLDDVKNEVASFYNLLIHFPKEVPTKSTVYIPGLVLDSEIDHAKEEATLFLTDDEEGLLLDLISKD